MNRALTTKIITPDQARELLVEYMIAGMDTESALKQKLMYGVDKPLYDYSVGELQKALQDFGHIEYDGDDITNFVVFSKAPFSLELDNGETDLKIKHEKCRIK